MPHQAQILDLPMLQATAADAFVRYVAGLKDTFDITLTFNTDPEDVPGSATNPKIAALNIYVKSEKGIRTKLATLSLGPILPAEVHPTKAEREAIVRHIEEQLPIFKVPEETTLPPVATTSPKAPTAPTAPKPTPSPAAPPPKLKTYYNNGRNGTVRETFGSPEAIENRKMQIRVGDAIANATKRDIPAGIVAQFYNGDISLEDLEKAIGASPTFNPKIGPQVKRK